MKRGLMRGGRFFFVAKCPDVVIPGEAKIDLETLWPHMLGAVQTGLRHLDAMREEEAATSPKMWRAA